MMLCGSQRIGAWGYFRVISEHPLLKGLGGITTWLKSSFLLQKLIFKSYLRVKSVVRVIKKIYLCTRSLVFDSSFHIHRSGSTFNRTYETPNHWRIHARASVCNCSHSVLLLHKKFPQLSFDVLPEYDCHEGKMFDKMSQKETWGWVSSPGQLSKVVCGLMLDNQPC